MAMDFEDAAPGMGRLASSPQGSTPHDYQLAAEGNAKTLDQVGMGRTQGGTGGAIGYPSAGTDRSGGAYGGTLSGTAGNPGGSGMGSLEVGDLDVNDITMRQQQQAVMPLMSRYPPGEIGIPTLQGSRRKPTLSDWISGRY